MVWYLGPDNKTRYPPRFKMVLDYMGLTKPEDDCYETLRLASLEFIKMVKENPEKVEDILRDFITCQGERVRNGEIKPITIRNYIKAVKTFAFTNGIKIVSNKPDEDWAGWGSQQPNMNQPLVQPNINAEIESQIKKGHHKRKKTDLQQDQKALREQGIPKSIAKTTLPPISTDHF